MKLNHQTRHSFCLLPIYPIHILSFTLIISYFYLFLYAFTLIQVIPGYTQAIPIKAYQLKYINIYSLGYVTIPHQTTITNNHTPTSSTINEYISCSLSTPLLPNDTSPSLSSYPKSKSYGRLQLFNATSQDLNAADMSCSGPPEELLVPLQKQTIHSKCCEAVCIYTFRN
ncbi:hypothetical protein AQUCO_02300043v1 [Aquilegia coerulea]|uniref:Uncharacterized protein n=1 Tax=Aquilegia coerulea TaxID=218851 RepID=A0A2G5DBS9_AQUCA|nr:hypothetical protein AQUCO_02300043v1 [Aquilegia coerulea]